ncbi:MAG: TrmH family RNA methyltransferase [Vicinamibacterales bacterium]
MVITSRQHAIVGRYRRAARGDATLALIDGWHLLQEAVAAVLPIVEIAVEATRVPAAASQAVVDQAARRGARVLTVSSSVMDALSPVKTPSGVVALVERPEGDWGRLRTTKDALIVMAVGLQDPGNTGALIRAAEAGGATGVVLAGVSADPWGWKALRAAMGSTFRMPVVTEADPTTVYRLLRAARVRLFATTPRAGRSIYDADLRSPSAMIVGNEGTGLDDDLVAAADEAISIPMCPPVESLNVAVATALLVYEAARQRRDGTRHTAHGRRQTADASAFRSKP